MTGGLRDDGGACSLALAEQELPRSLFAGTGERSPSSRCLLEDDTRFRDDEGDGSLFLPTLNSRVRGGGGSCFSALAEAELPTGFFDGAGEGDVFLRDDGECSFRALAEVDFLPGFIVGAGDCDLLLRDDGGSCFRALAEA